MEMQEIYNEAHLAGITAGNNAKPIPMTVCSADPLTGIPIAVIDVVADGVCGFAWVSMKANTPENRKFLTWAKKQNIMRKSCMGGFTLWVSDYNQSMQRKEAYASAFARVLNAHGIKCYAESRMDQNIAKKPKKGKGNSLAFIHLYLS